VIKIVANGGVMSAGSPHPSRLHQWLVSAVYAAFLLAPLFKFENAVQLRDFPLRAKLSCQSSINRLFTSAVPNPTDDLFSHSGSWVFSLALDLAEVRYDLFQGELESELRIPSLRKVFPAEKFQ
jgi:hypothetical protein